MATATRDVRGLANNAMPEYQPISKTEQQLISQSVHPQVHAATPGMHRCRLYLTTRDVEPGEHFYTEVWDSPGREEDISGLASDCDLVATFEDLSAGVVRKKIDDFSQEHRLLWIGSWNLRGSL